jgi:hypothetical protein
MVPAATRTDVRRTATARPHLVFGDDFCEMFHNQVLNLSEGRISVVQGVFEKPTTPRAY